MKKYDYLIAEVGYLFRQLNDQRCIIYFIIYFMAITPIYSALFQMPGKDVALAYLVLDQLLFE